MSSHDDGGQLTLSLTADQIAVPITWDVGYRGATAEGVPTHTWLPPAPERPELSDTDTAQMLDFVEDVIRYRTAPSTTFPTLGPKAVDRLDYSGSSGPGRASLTCTKSGVEVEPAANRGRHSRIRFTWGRVHRWLNARRNTEPEIARARDLAEAYHYLAYYSRVYGGPEHAPPNLLAGLRDAIDDLGGDRDVDVTPETLAATHPRNQTAAAA